MAGRETVGSSDDSSDSDVTVVVQRPKRRRILPGTAPILSTVYSNKVNSSLKFLPDNASTMAEMEKELQKKQDCGDLGSEAIGVPLPVGPPECPVLELSESEDADQELSEASQQRIRNSSPSPPPTPKIPVNKSRKGGFHRKIRNMEACLLDLGTVVSPVRNPISEDNDVIMVGSSPVPEMAIKVRRWGKIFRISLRVTDPLQRLVESVASRLEVDPSQILLLRGDEELSTTETPRSLNLTVADIIDCMVLSTTSDQESTAEQSPDKICLKLQGKDRESQLSLTIGKNEPLQSLMDQYKAAMGLSRKVCFMFEGKKLKGRSTAEQLGLESDDIIEVWT